MAMLSGIPGRDIVQCIYGQCPTYPNASTTHTHTHNLVVSIILCASHNREGLWANPKGYILPLLVKAGQRPIQCYIVIINRAQPPTTRTHANAIRPGQCHQDRNTTMRVI